MQSRIRGPLVELPVLISLIEVSTPMGKPLFLILYTQIKTPFRGVGDHFIIDFDLEEIAQ